MTTPASPAPSAGKSAPRRRTALLLVGGLLLLAAALVIGWHLLVGRFQESTDNAYVGGYLVQLTPQAAGTVTGVYAEDMQAVSQGQLLVKLDDADAQVALAQAEAGLADAVRGVRGLFAGRGQAQAMLAQQQAELARTQSEVARAGLELERAQGDLRRRAALEADQAVSAEEVQHARDAVATARQVVKSAQSVRDALTAQIAVARQNLAAANVPVEGLTIDNHPRVLLAAARLKEAFLAQARTRIVAPLSGHVVKRGVQIGQRVTAGAPLMAIVPLDQVWVDANFKESQLSTLRIGQPVALRADAWDHVDYSGVIVGTGVGTGGALAVLPAQNATGNWIKIVQRVPVRIAIDAKQLHDHPLRIGLSMRVTVDIHQTDGAALSGVLANPAGQQTTVFDDQSARADQRIARIIADNRG